MCWPKCLDRINNQSLFVVLCQLRTKPHLFERELRVSVLYHIVNKHGWEDPTIYQSSQHVKLTKRARLETVWLIEGSPTHVAIERIIKSKYLLKDLVYLTYFSHNGGVEVYNSLYNTFWPNNCTLVGMR